MSEINILEQMDFSMLEEMLNEIFPTGSMSFQEMIGNLMKGDMKFSMGAVFDMIKSALLQGIGESRNVFLAVLVLGIFGALLANVTELFENKQVAEFAHYFIFLLLAILLFKSFQMSLEIGEGAIGRIVDFMRAFIPAYSLSLCFSSGAMTAYSYYQFVFIMIYGLESLLFAFFIPLCQCYAFLSVMNGVSRAKRLEGILVLLDRVIKGGVKLASFLTIGSSLLHSMIMPAIDNVNTKLVQKSIGMVPGLGDITDSMTEVFLGSALLIKNSIGVAALILLLLICMVPLVKLFCIGGALKLAGALLGMFGERKQVHFIEQMGNGSFHMFQITLCTMVMFFISVALIAGVTMGGM
ncbi:MAG: hypothetical protein HDR01_14045 [Lachnospiraceae bacterium]|nr:hypothetical protein [Lachnospiraceae bacterium]